MKTADVKKDLAQKSEIMRMEKLLSQAKEAHLQQQKAKRAEELKKHQLQKLKEEERQRLIYARQRNIVD